MKNTLGDDFSEPRFSPSVVKTLLGFVSKYPWSAAAGVFFIFSSVAMTVAEPWFFGVIIDRIILKGRRDLLFEFAMAYFGVVGLRIFSTIMQSWFFERVGQGVMHDLRVSLLEQFQSLPISIYDKTPVGRLVTRIANDIPAMADMFAAGFALVAGNFLVVIGTMIWLLVLDVRLGLISLAVIPLMLWAGLHYSMKLKHAYRESRSRLSTLNAYLAENILGMKIVQLFNRQKLHFDRYKAQNEKYNQAQVDTIRLYAFLQPIITIASAVSIALVIYFGGHAVRQEAGGQGLAVGILVAFFSYLLALFQPFREMADKWNIFLAGLTSAERIFAILDWKTEIDPKKTISPPKPISGVRGRIEFKDVSFAYVGDNWVLKNFNLAIEPGSKVGFVGRTGAGKSTIMGLLLRFYEPQKGQILLDGVDIREWELRELRQVFGVIQQDVFLFSGSVKDNISLWRSLDKEDLEKIAPKLGSKLHMDLEERGSNLSSGERQLIAFARAKVARCPIWILDEATASVDSETEASLEEELTASASTKTILVVAHRLSTVKNADKIIVMHQGEIIEQGKHRELLSANGAYARMFKSDQALERVEQFTGV